MYHWLNKFHRFNMGTVIEIVGKYGLTVEVCHRNQPSIVS